MKKAGTLTHNYLSSSEFHSQAFIFHPQSLGRLQTSFSCSKSLKDPLRHGLIKITRNRLSPGKDKSPVSQFSVTESWSTVWLPPPGVKDCTRALHSFHRASLGKVSVPDELPTCWSFHAPSYKAPLSCIKSFISGRNLCLC